MEVQRRFVAGWASDGTCTYCGSLSQDLFFEAIEAGCELGPTDKDYKVYVRRPDPAAGSPRVVGSANFRPDWGDGWTLVTEENRASFPSGGLSPRVGAWVQVAPTPDTKQDKFYFQHLDDDGRTRFVELLNARVLNIGVPGHFYVMPFFARRP